MKPLDIAFRLVPMQIPDVTPKRPGGFGGLDTLLAGVEWFVIVGCFLGFIFSAGKIGLAIHNGQGSLEGLKGAILAIIGCIMVGGAATIFTVLT